MRIKFKVNNTDTLNLNQKWIRVILLIFAFLLILVGLAQLCFNVLMPEGNEKMALIVGNQYIKNLLMGSLFLLTYYVIKNSTPKNSN